MQLLAAAGTPADGAAPNGCTPSTERVGSHAALCPIAPMLQSVAGPAAEARAAAAMGHSAHADVGGEAGVAIGCRVLGVP